MSGQILFDVTALVAAPYRSGIQRVQREVIRYWPWPERLTFCLVDPSGELMEAPPAIRNVLCARSNGASQSFAADQRELARLTADTRPISLDAPKQILNLELFYEDWRADSYIRMCRSGWRVQWLVYDFMPWLHPELFPHVSTKNHMEYLRALRSVPEVAFISQQTCVEYVDRLMRGQRHPGPVISLGADGLGLERQIWSPVRRDIITIGTVEQRKNPHVVMDAVRALWTQGHDVRLVMAGSVDATQVAALQAFAAEAGPERFQLLDHPTDDAMRSALRRARAVLFASDVEGFGLPPYEAVHCGIPAIASDNLPSIQLLPPRGHIGLRSVTCETVADALRSVMDDTTAARLWAEAATIQLPTWRDAVRKLAEWTQSKAA